MRVRSPSDLLPSWLIESGSDAAATRPPAPLQLLPWDDGFTPSGCGGRAAQMVTDQPKTSPNAFHVVDAAVRAATADALYASAVRATVWGVYVPTRELSVVQKAGDEEALARLRHDVARAGDDEPTMSKEAKAQYRATLARLAVEEFLVAQCGGVVRAADWARTHGVAVWVIASDCDDETEYHLDYAEMLRFETNVVFPPIYGATLHASPLADADGLPAAGADGRLQPLDGGGFHVNTRGLDHYREYGYKTRLAPAKLSTDALEAAARRERGWQRVPYAYRRGIVCDGEFPHFSSRVRALPAGAKRVVVGFNLFPHAIGAFVESFPEHSDAFNKYVKLSQTAARQSVAPWSLESVRKNPRQAAFLKYLARKMREKQNEPQAPTLATQEAQPATTATIQATVGEHEEESLAGCRVELKGERKII